MYDNSPARRAKLQDGDVITAVAGRPLKGRSQDASVGLIQGPIGTPVNLTVRRDAASRDVELTRSAIEVPVVASEEKTVDGRKLAVISLAQFSSGAHGEVAAALRKAMKDGAKGVVFDLRDNGGGLVNEAELVASVFLRTARSSRPAVARCRGTLSATGDPIAPTRWSCWSTATRRRRGGDRRRRAAGPPARGSSSGTRTFGKGVFQEVIELSNGGALDITAGQYFTPAGATSAAAATTPAPGSRPTSPPSDDPKTRARQGARRRGAAARRRGRARRVTQRGRSARRPERQSRRACSRKRGRFLVAEPFFERGAAPVARRRAAATARPGQLVLVRVGGAGGGHGKVVAAGSAAPTWRAT